MDQFDIDAIEDYLLHQYHLLRKYHAYVEEELQKEPSGSTRMERTKVRLMTEYVEMMLMDIKNRDDEG